MRIFVRTQKSTSSLLFFFLTLFSCSENNSAQNQRVSDSLAQNIPEEKAKNPEIIDSAASGLTFLPHGNYLQSRDSIEKQRKRFYSEYSKTTDPQKRDSILDSARYYFTDQLLNTIIPFWYGTPWDFNGYTNAPNEGFTACGYFVSTTLKHAGININRYKMAQQSGLNEALTLQNKTSLKIFRYKNYDEKHNIISKLKQFPDGLYQIALSCHVGYLYIKNEIPYFIHSNYIDGYVMAEKAEFSDAFVSNIYVIADITHNNELIKKWIKNEEFRVVRGNN